MNLVVSFAIFSSYLSLIGNIIHFISVRISITETSQSHEYILESYATRARRGNIGAQVISCTHVHMLVYVRK